MSNVNGIEGTEEQTDFQWVRITDVTEKRIIDSTNLRMKKLMAFYLFMIVGMFGEFATRPDFHLMFRNFFTWNSASFTALSKLSFTIVMSNLGSYESSLAAFAMRIFIFSSGSVAR